MKRKTFLVFFIACCWVAPYAQECDLLLTTARYYKDKNDCSNAIEWYQKILETCGDFDGKVKAELKECQAKLAPKQASSEYVPTKPVLGLISDRQILFDAAGGSDSHIQVTCKGDWFATTTDDWIEVSENGYYLEVRCRPNPGTQARIGQINIIAEGGTSTGIVTVQQKAGKAPSRPTQQTSDNQTPSVKVSFEAGKDAPSFENVWSIIKRLEDNHILGLQIEIPWCKNKYPIDLIEKRIQNITDYFIASGIDKSRITQNIIIIDVAEGNTECDRAHLKIVKH